MPTLATSSPKTALSSVDLPTPVLPNTARLNRPIASDCCSYSLRNESLSQSFAIAPPAGGGSATSVRGLPVSALALASTAPGGRAQQPVRERVAPSLATPWRFLGSRRRPLV